MSGTRRIRYFGWLLVLATAVATSSGMAQNLPPAAPSGQGTSAANCDVPKSDGSSASIVQTTGESLQRKHWQPQGGVIQFTLKSFVRIPDDASFFVCFRWKTRPDNTAAFDQVRPDRLDRTNDGTTWTVTTTIPIDMKDIPPGKVQLRVLPLVPLADVRILAVQDKSVLADATTVIGITHPAAAIFLAIATVVIMLVVLNIVADQRLKHDGIRKAPWFLRIIATPGAYASLSQLQIVLWTLVVAASAVYVMALSGDLIEITNGTLVLLGIAGAAGLGAKVHTESQNSAAQAAADAAQREADQAKIEAVQKAAAASAAGATETDKAASSIAENAKQKAEVNAKAAADRAKAFKNPPACQTPRWSDLIVNETTGIDGAVTREIDVTRFQMLLFTLITAAFVLMNVVTTYVIPEIPTGFLTLMGISNGVYLGAKVAQGSGS